MKIKIFAISIVLLALLISCVKERGDMPVEGIPTTLQLKTRDAGDKEFTIESLRVMMFRSSGEPLSNELFTGVSITDPITISTTTGERVLVIVANEPISTTANLSGYKTLEQVGIVTLTNSFTQGDILPFTYQTNLTINEAENAPVAAKLERMVSKTAMQISKSGELKDVEVKLLEIQLLRTAKSSYLLPLATGDWVASAGDASPLTDLPTIDLATDNVLSAESAKTILFTNYLYEYSAGQAEDMATALRVKILNNGVNKEYILPFFFHNKDGQKIYGIARNSYTTIEATVYPKGIRIEKYTVDKWESEAPWDKDIGSDDNQDGNTSIDMWIDDDGRIVIEGLT